MCSLVSVEIDTGSGSSHHRKVLCVTGEDALSDVVLAPFRALDRVRWALGRRPATPPVRVTETGGLEATGPLARGMLAAARRVT